MLGNLKKTKKQKNISPELFGQQLKSVGTLFLLQEIDEEMEQRALLGRRHFRNV